MCSTRVLANCFGLGIISGGAAKVACKSRVRILADGGRTVFGRMRYTSARIGMDKPIEMFLSPVFFVDEMDDPAELAKANSRKANNKPEAAYIRLRAEQVLEVYSFDEI